MNQGNAALPNLQLPLLLTRLSIAIFLLPWIMMRFTAPDGAKAIASKYYMISNMSDLMTTAIGIGWLVLLAAFLVGFRKRISYGLVMLFHGVGTLTTVPNLIPGSANFAIVFYAAIPTLAAMMLLYVLRDQDRLLSLNR